MQPSNQSNGPLSNELYSIATGSSSSDVFITTFAQRDPTQYDFNFPIKKRWLNLPLAKEWILIGFSNITGQTLAIWELISSANNVAVQSIFGDDGISNDVTPDPITHEIELLGAIVPNATNSKPVFFKKNATTIEELDVQVSVAASTSLINNAGLSSFLNTQFTVNSSTGFVQLIGGTTPPTLGLIPDAHTVPGTSPVVPNVSGNITLEGGTTFATGTQANPIRTNSLAANTMDFQIQLAGSNASTATANNFGVAQFDSNQFLVTGGFVQVNSAFFAETITGNTGGPLSPTAGNWNIFGASTAAGTTPVSTSGTGSTLTINVQKSQAIGSTNASNVGLAAFNSSDFTVDANGFVSISNFSPFAYTNVTHNGTNPSPYTVSTTDFYLSADTTALTAGTITIKLPNVPTNFREFVIKDRTGAASTNNISVTTVGGSVTIDGQTTYTIAGNYGAINLLFNGTSYEVY